MNKPVGIQDDETVKQYKTRKKQESQTRDKKEQTEMNTLKTFAKTILPWLVIFAAVCAGTGYFVGHEQGKRDERTITKTVQAEVVSQLKAGAK